MSKEFEVGDKVYGLFSWKTYEGYVVFKGNVGGLRDSHGYVVCPKKGQTPEKDPYDIIDSRITNSYIFRSRKKFLAAYIKQVQGELQFLICETRDKRQLLDKLQFDYNHKGK